MEEAFLSAGAAIGYWRGSLPGLIADAQALRPTQFHGVPRVFERIYASVQDKLRAPGFLKKALFNWAYSSKLARLRAGVPSGKAAPMWDAVMFSKVRFRSGARACACSGMCALERKSRDRNACFISALHPFMQRLMR